MSTLRHNPDVILSASFGDMIHHPEYVILDSAFQFYIIISIPQYY